ncbi:MAG: hypothetical protein ABIQ12_13380 [Opitutaceae bacterium]
MIKLTPRFLFAVALCGAAATVPASASGSYSGRPPKPPATATSGGEMKMDREKYGLGQKIYDGGAKLVGGGDANSQLARLKALQGMLPADAMKMKDLPALAGKLSAAEIDALEYFVKQRFAMKK